MAPITASSAPGTRGANRWQARITASTASATVSVPACAWPRRATVETTCVSASCPSLASPNSPESSPPATCTPTPVRKPISALRDRKSARKPSRNTRANTSMTATASAARLVSPTYSGEPSGARATSIDARIAAVAESAATTRCRDAPSTAKAITGSSSV